MTADAKSLAMSDLLATLRQNAKLATPEEAAVAVEIARRIDPRAGYERTHCVSLGKVRMYFDDEQKAAAAAKQCGGKVEVVKP
jgi:hypothetical protein